MTDPLSDDNPFEDKFYGEIIAELNKPVHVSNYTNLDRVYDFHAAMGMTINQWPPTQKEVMLRNRLISEEFNELGEELYDDIFDGVVRQQFDKKKVAKELADLLYVVYGTAVSFGIDIDSVFEEVHASNMSKLGDDGKPIRRQDGKVLKGPNYRQVNLDFVT